MPEDVCEELIAALKLARPYVEGALARLENTNFQHIPAEVLSKIDKAIAKAESSQ